MKSAKNVTAILKILKVHFGEQKIGRTKVFECCVNFKSRGWGHCWWNYQTIEMSINKQIKSKLVLETKESLSRKLLLC